MAGNLPEREPPGLVGALEASEQRYVSLFGANPDPIFAFDRDGRLVSANAALERLTGLRHEQLLGRPLLSLLPERERNPVWTRFLRARGGEPQSCELVLLGSGSREIALSATLIPAFSADAVTGVYGIARDITRQKEIEQALRETDALYRLFAENVQDMISVHDREGVFIYASPSATRLIGYAPEELFGRSVYDLIEPADRESLRAQHAAILRREGKQPATFRARHRDGSQRWFETTARVAMEATTGQPWRIIAVTRDITERRAVETELAHVRQQNDRAAPEAVARELAAVLAALTEHAAQLSDALAHDTPAHAHAEHVRTAAVRAGELVRRLPGGGPDA